jgi:NADH-quinone oxidoreductase subunit C
MSDALENLAGLVLARCGEGLERVASRCGELTFEVPAERLVDVCRLLRDDPGLKFEQLVDLTGVDYLDYGRVEWNTETATNSGFSRGRALTPTLSHPMGEGARSPQAGGDVPPTAGEGLERRFAVVYHLLSVAHNRRLRLRAWCEGGEPPMLDSVVEIWASANWNEREAFDLFGILFRGHPDLRRILTDYGFVGHPFRKDFPLIGNVEVRYDESRGRVVYEPVAIEPRTLVPRVIREDNRYDAALKDAPKKDVGHG